MTSAGRTHTNSARPLAAVDVVYRRPGTEDAHPNAALLRAVNLRIEPGEVVGLTGASGSGKTSLVRLLSGLAAPHTGTVALGTTPVVDVRSRPGADVRGRIGVVFQSPRSAMDGRMRLDRAIALAAEQAARREGANGESDTAVAELTEQLGLHAAILARRPHEVSDGQLQRAALLRTFAHRPEVLLCDEVTAALDPISSAAVMGALRHIAHARRRGVLVVSHDIALLAASADRVLAVVDGQIQDR